MFTSGYYLENPIGNTIKMKFKPDICLSSVSAEKFLLNASFILKRIDTLKPTVKISSSSGLIPLRWIFHQGGVNSNDANPANSFTLSSLKDGMVINNTEVDLVDFKLETSLNFVLAIACNKSAFSVSFNNYSSESIPFNSSVLNDISDVSISGAVTILKAGYGGEVV